MWDLSLVVGSVSLLMCPYHLSSSETLPDFAKCRRVRPSCATHCLYFKNHITISIFGLSIIFDIVWLSSAWFHIKIIVYSHQVSKVVSRHVASQCNPNSVFYTWAGIHPSTRNCLISAEWYDLISSILHMRLIVKILCEMGLSKFLLIPTSAWRKYQLFRFSFLYLILAMRQVAKKISRPLSECG